MHNTLVGVGLVDVAAGLSPIHRDPPDLVPTWITGGGRVDRIYATCTLWYCGAVMFYAQKNCGSSNDHQMIMAELNLDKLARATAATEFFRLPSSA